MRVFALSDIHVDYDQNRNWLEALSETDYQQDLLLLAGDITEDLTLLSEVLTSLAQKFSCVLFVPGNHDLWVRQGGHDCSLQKYQAIELLCSELGIVTGEFHDGELSIVPLLGWYDFSFGQPDRYLQRAWRDFRACRWPAGLDDEQAVTRFFLGCNEARLGVRNDTVISFSHFLPRLDVMPAQIPEHRRRVYPVLGSNALGEQVSCLQPDLHIYGHSHVNQAIELDGTLYINNAFAYPNERRIARKNLLCVWDSDAGIQC